MVSPYFNVGGRFSYGSILSLGQWQRLINLSYQERAARILEAWIDPFELHPSSVRDMITKAHSSFEHEEVAPVKKLDSGVYTQELFYGPTASFKDLALQLMPRIFEEAVSKRQSGQVDVQKYRVLSYAAKKRAIYSKPVDILQQTCYRQAAIRMCLHGFQSLLTTSLLHVLNRFVASSLSRLAASVSRGFNKTTNDN